MFYLYMKVRSHDAPRSQSPLSHALEANQGQMDGLFSQFPYKCHLEEVASVGALVVVLCIKPKSSL